MMWKQHCSKRDAACHAATASSVTTATACVRTMPSSRIQPQVTGIASISNTARDAESALRSVRAVRSTWSLNHSRRDCVPDKLGRGVHPTSVMDFVMHWRRHPPGRQGAGQQANPGTQHPWQSPGADTLACGPLPWRTLCWHVRQQMVHAHKVCQ